MANQENFANSVAEQLPYLTRFVRRLTRYDANVEDIVQQTVLKALIHVDQFRFQSTLKTWLTSIAHNEVRQMYRSKWQSSTERFTDSLEGARSSSESDAASSTDQAKEHERLVRVAVSRLPHAYRCIIELCDFQDISLQEAATQLSLSLSAVKSRRYRAREKLRPLVKKLRV